MEIKILGLGCPNCIKLEKVVNQVVKELKLEATVEKVTNLDEILSYGVMSTPALVLDGKVLFSGRVPNAKKITELLK